MLSRKLFLVSASLSLLGAAATQAQTSSASVSERVVVYGTLSSSDIGLAADKVAGSLQSVSADTITSGRDATILDALNTSIAGVSLSDSQGNEMFQDLRFHGFEASPLQGTPQGIAVYQNGVRLNEGFGDTVNWDAIPENAIQRMDVWSSNPVFGLNALGGSVNMVMKNGFNTDSNDASAQGGSYGHAMVTGELTRRDGNASFYVSGELVKDDGWRLHSPSQLGRLYADAGWQFGDSEVHAVFSGATSELGVVGPTPIQLTQRSSTSVYTWPQTTHNTTGSFALNGKTRLADHWQLEANAYVRSLRQRHIDGNDGDFESCSKSSSFGGQLCLEDDAFGTPAGGKTVAFRNQFLILDQNGLHYPDTAGVVYGTIDQTYTDTVTQGATLQASSDMPLGGMTNYFTVGASIDHSAIGFRSTSTLATEQADFDVKVNPAVPGEGSIIHSAGNLGYAPVTLAAMADYEGLYAVDALDLTNALTATVGARINVADISTRDRSGIAAELNGTHGYTHLNPMAGLTYKVMDGLTLFGGYSQANRAPTPLELDCADRTQPCLLEGSLVADPALKQVVSETMQGGLRGSLDGITYSGDFFNTNSHNDIVALASVIQGRGYYTNVPSTRRQGADVSAQYDADGWDLHASYSYLQATYQFTGTLASGSNPKADANGNVTVTPGKQMPMNPANTFRAGGDFHFMPGFSAGADGIFTGSQYYDGDNSNLNPKLPSTFTLNLRAAYDVAPGWQVFGVINNVLNNHDALYGTYFEADDTAGLVTPALTDNRTITLEQPISFQVGVKTRF